MAVKMGYLFRKLLFWFVSTVICIYFVIGSSAQEEPLPALPDCTSRAAGLDSLVLVSTIEGHLYALDGDGNVLWNVNTGPGPMLSSSIHNLELGKDGHFLRMIPSLSGGLYQFNGDNVEVIPFSADDLLQSSFRKDDIVLTGGKESRTYGIDAKTGTVLYEWSMQGREHYLGDNSSEVEEVLVLKRLTHTVRAVEPRTSFERWNFSVARLNVMLSPDPAALCHGSKELKPLNFDVRVIVPDGLVCGISLTDPKKVLWKHEFDSPIVSAWTLNKGELKEVDLFSGLQWNHDKTHGHEKPISPSLYIGMHKKQLYIQESVQMQQHLGDTMNRQNLITDESIYTRIPWRPIPALPGNTLGLLEHDNADESRMPQLTDESNQAVRTTAMSVLYASEYVNGNGFYLYSLESQKKARQAQCGLIEAIDDDQADNQTIEVQIPMPDKKPSPSSHGEEEVQFIIITSLWYWWKEVLLISIGTAVLVNCMMPQGVLKILRLRRPLEPTAEEGKLLPFTHPHGASIPPVEVAQEERPATPIEYTSRYLQDFQPVQCLGKGGFGVVFEARKKFDDCLYAVKRIPLTNKEESRERVLREVRALAKLDHNNIVRYFNSWLECPPPGWQEDQDKQLASMFKSLEATSSLVSEDQTNYSEECSQSVNPLMERKRLYQEQSWNIASSNITSHNMSGNTMFSRTKNELVQDTSDSYIVFDASGPSGEESDVEDECEENDSLDRRKDSVISVCSSSTGSSEFPLARKKNVRPKQISICRSSQRQKISTSYLFIQMQLCQKDSLKDWLQSTPKRDYLNIINFFEQIVMAVEYVHLNNLIHRDLKPSNIFFSMDGHIKIGDFGLVTTMLEETDDQRTAIDSSSSSGFSGHTAQVGTELYMSPEQRKGKPYNYKVDIYSLGLILFELLMPFGTEMERIQIMQSLHRQKFPPDFPVTHPNEYELLKMMLDHRPEKRPTTFGIRARPPLRNRQTEEILSDLSEENHFELPTRQRSSTSIHKLSSSSSSSTEFSPNSGRAS
ncbi:eukaryotic translation initiation factor 2-alpha kinase [Frankliniella occidentalis]|uniref:non-specific serine/threonine protein kinase n=1 Tax=Frankliniella occidentalis TaxID=133901 RepID=A0A6J1SP24_FRAOC|nr:eukaryotic translation initiation factor 2-alpha kinase [Frankliniella occidentalis]